ncbi:MAG: serine/threonine protein kinase, partial [Pirellulaceae bacterium]|nr:serine/threonine protein kinase [Pirellulaceae bacterium]
MTKHAAAALIARGRSGDETAFGQLFQEVSPFLRHSAASELAELAALTDPDEVVHWTRKEGWKIFATFEGSTAEELQTWLSGILLERIRLDRQQSSEDAETLVQRNSFKPEQDVGPAEDSTDLADRKAGSAQDKHSNETLSYGSVDPHATVAGPPKSPVAGDMPIKKFGEYDILQTIARGGMGVVYKARQRRLNRVVALKMILAGQFANQDDVERFYLEAESAAQLRHPNIVGIHEVGECDGQHYFSMNYIDGESLAERVRERPLSPLVAARFVKAISGAMAYAHTHGVLHRDLKPSNVMIDQDEVPLITDFGLAKRMEDELKLTVAGSILGTPSYMPPEQASGKIDELSVRSDIYSLGAILYELLTGRPPFGAAHPFETLQQVIEVEPVLPRLQNSSVPVDLETICLKCLQKEQERRYASGQELADELERFIQGEPILARPIGVVERVWRWCRRNPKIAASISMTVASILLALVATTFLYVRAEAARAQTAIALGKAETSRDQLLAAINDLYTSWGDVKLLNEPGFEEVRAELLGTARKLHRETLQLLGDDPKIRQELGAAN